MGGQKSTSPSSTQPQGRNGHVSQRGMLSIVMLSVSLGTLGIAMLGGAKLAFDLFWGISNPGLVAAAVAWAG